MNRIRDYFRAARSRLNPTRPGAPWVNVGVLAFSIILTTDRARGAQVSVAAVISSSGPFLVDDGKGWKTLASVSANNPQPLYPDDKLTTPERVRVTIELYPGIEGLTVKKTIEVVPN